MNLETETNTPPFEMSLGVCIRDTDDKVQFQNDVCKSVCGIHPQEVCLRCSDIPHYKEVHKDLKTMVTLFRVPQNTKLKRALLSSNLLTPREKEIVKLLLLGYPNTRIIHKLFIAKSTLKTHLNRIYKKMSAVKGLRSTSSKLFTLT